MMKFKNEQDKAYQVPVHFKGTTKFLDAWIPSTRVLIATMKSRLLKRR